MAEAPTSYLPSACLHNVNAELGVQGVGGGGGDLGKGGSSGEEKRRGQGAKWKGQKVRHGRTDAERKGAEPKVQREEQPLMTEWQRDGAKWES